jgi:hypothetical protein
MDRIIAFLAPEGNRDRPLFAMRVASPMIRERGRFVKNRLDYYTFV